MLGFPDWYSVSIIFIFGLIIGSFLDVFVCRFHTGKSINGRSRCLSCGHKLSWYELFPLFSYLFLRGRCRVCSAHIPFRLFFMELFTGLLFVFVYFHTVGYLPLLLGLVLMACLIVITMYDMYHMVIPNEFVVAIGILALGYFFLKTSNIDSIQHFLVYIIPGIGGGLFYFSLWLVSKGRWIGLGDAKLAVPLGFFLGASGVFSFVVLSFWVGAAVSILLLLLQKLHSGGKGDLPFLSVPLTMKSEVPFAPFMIVAFVLVYFVQVDILKIITFAL